MRKYLLLSLIAISFLSCKKGEDDPVISFLSRKERITNDWVLQAIDVEQIKNNEINIKTNEMFSDSVDIDSLNSFRQLTINRDGSFKKVNSNILFQLTSGGFWSFGGGGIEKNKSQLLLQNNNDSIVEKGDVITNWTEVYYIRKLKKNKLELVQTQKDGNTLIKTIYKYIKK